MFCSILEIFHYSLTIAQHWPALLFPVHVPLNLFFYVYLPINYFGVLENVLERVCVFYMLHTISIVVGTLQRSF